MSKQLNENAFESNIEEILLTKADYIKGNKADWNRSLALFPSYIINYLKQSQPKLWSEVANLQGDIIEKDIIATLAKELDNKGTLDILRHGFKYRGKVFSLLAKKPAHNMSQEVLQQYKLNSVTVTRQILCHTDDNSEIDMLISINGLPIATIELKTPTTGQNYKHAINQYKTDRKPSAPLFLFKKRALVHFAVDTDEVWMSTKLEKDKTVFLPFNRGSNPNAVNCGAGNPINPDGYKTSYLFEETLQKDSLIDIVSSFILYEKDDRKEAIVFPRYHQLDAVRKLTSTAQTEGAGHNYLIQHSAGSGKTKSIAWLAHRLSSLHADDKIIFDSVIVITDRKVLDTQLQEAIYQIEHKDGVVKCIDEDSKQLAEAMIDGTKIIITTLQKFPFIVERLLKIAGVSDINKPDEESVKKAKEWERKIAGKRYAIIADEAHSSQTGESSRELKQLLGAKYISDDADWEDNLNIIMESRKKQQNLSFFAFTATPKGKTIQLFGRVGESGKPESFHIYSMKQAIEERFILDVLKNYTIYQTFYKIAKTIEDDKVFSKKQASKKIAKFLKLHPTNINQKIEIIVEHFRSRVKFLLNGTAKAMIVTQTREHAVRYMEAIKKYIAEHNYNDISPLVAFSGEIVIDENGEKHSYTEPSMNIDKKTGKHISEKNLPKAFATDEYNILIVANKYQTGFDEPKLCAMYIDKRLDGVQAVQTLSRLNRCFPAKEEPFVLDFVNKPECIYYAFKPYYETTLLENEADPTHLENLMHELNEMRLYSKDDIEEFASIFYKRTDKQKSNDHIIMQQIIDRVLEKYRTVEDEEKESFRNKMKAFINLYSFVSQIIDYSDSEWEKFYTFSRAIFPKLNLLKDYEPENPEDAIILTHLRNQKIRELEINLVDGDDVKVNSPTDVGTKEAEDEKVPLSVLIENMNEKYGTNFTEADALFIQQIVVRAINDETIINKAKSNPYDRFILGLKDPIQNLMINQINNNSYIATRYFEDKEFGNEMLLIIANEIYNKINDDTTSGYNNS